MGHRSGSRRAGGALAVLVCLLGAAHQARAQGIDIQGFKAQVFQLLNEQRAASGLPALRRVAPLETSAQSYSETMMRATAGGPVYFSHTSPDGTSFSDRITQAGYTWFAIGENIAAGQRTPQEVVTSWMNSPGHRANILNPGFRDIGLGLAAGPGSWSNGYSDPQVLWWTTDFGSSTVSYPAPGSAAQPAPAAPAAAPAAPAAIPRPTLTPGLTPDTGLAPLSTGPAITRITDLDGVPLIAAAPGTALVLRGSGLVEHDPNPGLVLFTTGSGLVRTGTINGWLEGAIVVSVPNLIGPVQVSALVPTDRGPVSTNSLTLRIATAAGTAP